MNSKDLKNYRYTEKWVKDRIEYIEQQKLTINRMTAILDDMPKGTRQVQDREAEKLAELLDSFEEYMNEVLKIQKRQKQIIKILDKIGQPYENILYQVNVKGVKMNDIAEQENYSYTYIRELHAIGIKKFDEIVNNLQNPIE